MVRVPQIVDIEVAIRIYYEKCRLYSRDISELFGGKISESKICQLKRQVRDVMIEREMMLYDASSVDTKVAYEIWGICVDQLEQNLKKLRQLKLRRAE